MDTSEVAGVHCSLSVSPLTTHLFGSDPNMTIELSWIEKSNACHLFIQLYGNERLGWKS